MKNSFREFDRDQIRQKECLVTWLKFVKHSLSFTDIQYMHFVHCFHFVCRACSRVSSVEFKVMYYVTFVL